MARHLKTRKAIDDYVAYVDTQATHHAPEVRDIVVPLADAVLARLNLVADRVEVFERDGKIARTCWVTLAGNRYVFSYDYAKSQIVLRDRSIQGAELFRFDNNVSLHLLKKTIAEL
jgi:hypothetical protein